MVWAPAPEPGEEISPQSRNWNPGPDGDNCVTDQPPPDDIPADSFVGKTNYHSWVAGPDGKNAITEESDEAAGMMNKIMGRKLPSRDDRTMRNANLAMKQMDTGGSQNSAFDNQVASMMRIRDRGKDRSDQDSGFAAMGRANDMGLKAQRLPAIAKDTDAVREMNKHLQTLVSDSSYDLDDVGEEIGRGDFGKVFMG